MGDEVAAIEKSPPLNLGSGMWAQTLSFMLSVGKPRCHPFLLSFGLDRIFLSVMQ